MTVNLSQRISSIGSYAFAEVDRLVGELASKGIEPIDFGVGDPTDPTPGLIREACQIAVDARARSGYPPYVGLSEYRSAASDWMTRRFGLDLDPETEIAATVGSKEAVFHIPLAFVDPGDVVLVPTPGYPPYQRGTTFAGGEVHFMPLLPENGFLPDLDGIPDDVWEKAKILWVNYPNSPSGVVAGAGFFEKAIAMCRERGVLFASDEAYSEIYFGDPPPCALEYGREGVVCVYSLSKRSAMTNYRIGWVCGDEHAVSAFKKVKTNIDSGTPTFIQDAARAALSDESHVTQMREAYRAKRDILCAAFRDMGLPDCTPEATLYVWQDLGGRDSLEFCKELLDPDVAVVATPGAWITDDVPGQENPGKRFARFALVPPIEKVELAAERIRKRFA